MARNLDLSKRSGFYQRGRPDCLCVSWQVYPEDNHVPVFQECIRRLYLLLMRLSMSEVLSYPQSPSAPGAVENPSLNGILSVIKKQNRLHEERVRHGISGSFCPHSATSII